MIKKLLTVIMLALFIAGCGAQTENSSENVQDIKPGDKSVIQPPNPAVGSQRSTLEEKPL